jgi:hypothetical protein
MPGRHKVSDRLILSEGLLEASEAVGPGGRSRVTGLLGYWVTGLRRSGTAVAWRLVLGARLNAASQSLNRRRKQGRL